MALWCDRPLNWPAISFPQFRRLFVGCAMRRALPLLATVLLNPLTVFTAPGCQLNIVFQHPPKTDKRLDRIFAKAEKGDRTAQFEVGLAYETGSGVGQDHAEAAKWYRRAADQGFAAAQNNVGGM